MLLIAISPAHVLHVCSIPRHKAAEARLARDKYPKWWVQSYLAGVSTLAAGGRTTEGKLEEVRAEPMSNYEGAAFASMAAGYVVIRTKHRAAGYILEACGD